MVFRLDPALSKDSLPVARQNIFQVRLMNDERFFWILIIPEISGATELHELTPDTVGEMMQLAGALGHMLKLETAATKINIATIGNVVAQFHLHVVARTKSDDSWPAPVWGNGIPVPLSSHEMDRRILLLRNFLQM
ncbi:MAG: HIT family protein [Pseudomonadota bacterium]|nr:HIT family protein [Pseudomonadota bacterium]